MTTDSHDWFNTAVQALADPQGQRVWSIIVSFLGDMAQGEGAGISSAALTRVITPLGIKPEAIRVALHRLRKDGWTDSERRGRGSVHFLTPHGRAQSAEVTPRIYMRRTSAPQDWHMMIAGTPEGLELLDALADSHRTTMIRVNRQTLLAPGEAAAATPDLLVLNAEIATVPAWLKEELFPAALRKSCAALDAALLPLGAAPPLDPLRRACLRTLIVHRWRRIVLRHPNLSASFQPADWRGEACRAKVFALLDAMPLPSLLELEQAEALPLPEEAADLQA
ncbi:PaaX family transcriptional regulator C-terminal domain-containing protein [Arenibacterium sp. LLYu02]|uniref:PaaX family transcriptional regulator C-terminal domain-containing protein n=1 Tax=Arenibacterium sp. LLYu02 TaxID=3404132 RepID=UPI003B2223DD